MTSPLLLLVHGRAGGVVPAELTRLATELRQRRRAPVEILTLTAPSPPEEPHADERAADRRVPHTLVPLFLLPGSHVRVDVPGLAAVRARRAPLRRVPFLGAWPAWQQALAREAAALQSPPGGREHSLPRLLHHPVEGPLARRYLRHLERVCRVHCHPAPYSATAPDDLLLPSAGPLLPLALAANRLTDSLGDRLGPPLLARHRCRAAVLSLLTSLP